MFCSPPEHVIRPGARVDGFCSVNRSTPNQMWRQVMPDGSLYDIWGTHFKNEQHVYGYYEGAASWVLSAAESLSDVQKFAWPDPSWWDFTPLPAMIDRLQKDGPFHVRFRLGSFFEQAWWLRGLEHFMLDIGFGSPIADYVMDRILEVMLANLQTVLELAGNRLDMIYVYDDVATQNSLMISPKDWRRLIRPRQQKIFDQVHRYGKLVMYHCDGAIAPLIPELIEIGVDVLNPIQPDARGMDSAGLKQQFGSQLTFHGGVDIIRTLPRGNVQDVQAEVRQRVRVLGEGGGYILCSSHHIQADTPLQNILAMYEPGLRVHFHDQPLCFLQPRRRRRRLSVYPSADRDGGTGAARNLGDARRLLHPAGRQRHAQDPRPGGAQRGDRGRKHRARPQPVPAPVPPRLVHHRSLPDPQPA
jgi:uroporphyrinogen decarboxylase